MSGQEEKGKERKQVDLFQLACQDVARMTSVLSFDSHDLLKPRSMQTKSQNIQDQLRYFGNAFYLSFFGGFVPYFYKLLPFKVFQLWSVLNTLLRKGLLSPLLRLFGYARLCNWNKQNAPGLVVHTADELKPYAVIDTAKVGRLASLDLLDPEINSISNALYEKHALVMPHSQANPNLFSAAVNIFTGTTFPGNFFGHLIGVWKALQAWGQPRYICRGGYFHSVYGTNQYRNYLWKYSEREQVKKIIGAGAEELAFLICTAERGDLTQSLCEVMYGFENLNAKLRIFAARAAFRRHRDSGKPMTARLGEEGFPVTNHVTGQTVHFPPKTFAAFTIVMIADFLEQGVSGFGFYEDDDISLFSYIKLRFWADVISFISPYLDVVPPVFEKYNLLKEAFKEPSRSEILLLKQCLTSVLEEGEVADAKATLARMVNDYPWLPESKLSLARLMSNSETYKGFSKAELLGNAKQLVREWGMTFLKDLGHPKEFMAMIEKA